jgi:hypothetical protein
MTPEELVRTACPIINDLGWAYFFVPETSARAEELGIDVLTFYFLGRGGVLGDCEPEVVASAFGYFNPALVKGAWDGGKEKLAPRDAGRAYLECAAVYGRAHFADIDGLEGYCAAAEAVRDAADPAGLSLFSAAAVEPLAADAPARAMQLTSVLRELRGSTHLLAVRASGLAPYTAHFLKRPGMWGVFGWQDDQAPSPTDDDRAALVAAEELTDRMVLPAFSVLDEPGRDLMLTGLERMTAAVAAAG